MLADLDSIELLGWLEYLKMDDEVQRVQMARAIVLALGDESKAPQVGDEEVIDTTSTEFRQHFQGFVGGTEIKQG